MIILEVVGIRGIDNLTLKFRPGAVTKWRDMNAVGKTSASAALAGILARHTDPMNWGVQKARHYVNDKVDADDAKARLTRHTEQGDIVWSITWRVGAKEFDEVGTVPPAIPLILATPKVLTGEMALKKGLVESMCETEITRKELIDRLSKIFSETTDVATATSLADQILSSPNGWAEVDGIARNSAVEGKRKWRDAVARDKQHAEYGPAQAAAWRPSLWEPAYDGMTAETVDRKIFDLRAQLEVADDAVRDLKNKQEEVLTYKEQQSERERLMATLKDLQGKVVPAAKIAGAKDQLYGLKKQRDEKEVQLATFDPQISAHAQKLELHTDAGAEMGEIEKTLERHRADQHKDMRELDAKLDQEQAILEKMEQPPPPGTCALCGQSTPPNLDRHREAVIAQKTVVQNLEQEKHGLPARWGGLIEKEMELREQWKPYRLADDAAARLKEEVDRLTTLRVEFESGLQTLRGQITALEATVAVYDNSIAFTKQAEEIEGAIRGLDKIIATVTIHGPTDTEVEDAQREADRIRALIRQQEHIKDMIDIHLQAQAAHSVVSAWERIRHFVGMEGIRAEKVADGMKKLEVIMQRIQQTVDLKGVVVKNAKILVGNRDIEVVAESEQWFASVVVKLAMLIHKKQPLAIIDGADRLDPVRYKQAFEVITAIAEKQNMAILLTETVR